MTISDHNVLRIIREKKTSEDRKKNNKIMNYLKASTALYVLHMQSFLKLI